MLRMVLSQTIGNSVSKPDGIVQIIPTRSKTILFTAAPYSILGDTRGAILMGDTKSVFVSCLSLGLVAMTTTFSLRHILRKMEDPPLLSSNAKVNFHPPMIVGIIFTRRDMAQNVEWDGELYSSLGFR
jgi:hypothetical protein